MYPKECKSNLLNVPEMTFTHNDPRPRQKIPRTEDEVKVLKALYAFYTSACLLYRFCTAIAYNYQDMGFNSRSNYKGTLKQPFLKNDELSRILAVNNNTNKALRRLNQDPFSLNKNEEKFQDSIEGVRLMHLADLDVGDLWDTIKHHPKPEEHEIDFKTPFSEYE
jgi:hypothetical protein